MINSNKFAFTGGILLIEDVYCEMELGLNFKIDWMDMTVYLGRFSEKATKGIITDAEKQISEMGHLK